MTAAKLVPAIRRIAERATHEDEMAILALLALCERQHAALADVKLILTNDDDQMEDDPVGRCWQHRCSDGVGGCTAISEDSRVNGLNHAISALAAGRDAGL